MSTNFGGLVVLGDLETEGDRISSIAVCDEIAAKWEKVLQRWGYFGTCEDDEEYTLTSKLMFLVLDILKAWKKYRSFPCSQFVYKHFEIGDEKDEEAETALQCGHELARRILMANAPSPITAREFSELAMVMTDIVKSFVEHEVYAVKGNMRINIFNLEP